MSSDKFLLFNLDDKESKKLGEVISNSTCKKITNILTEKELSSSEISKELSIPLNTVEYNLKKLQDAGIVEVSKNWWSVKGKKVETFKIANKLIVISPKKSLSSKLSSILPVLLIAIVLTSFVSYYFSQDNLSVRDSTESLKVSAAFDSQSVQESNDYNSPGLWFGLGALVVLIAFVMWNFNRL